MIWNALVHAISDHFSRPYSEADSDIVSKLPYSETDSDIVSINNVNYETNTEYFHRNDPGWNPDMNGPGYDPVGYKTIN